MRWTKGSASTLSLNAFQEVVHAYNIDKALIVAFLDSMEMDLTQQAYTPEGYDQYIYGSAEVVGLMCLAYLLQRGSGIICPPEGACAKIRCRLPENQFPA